MAAPVRKGEDVEVRIDSLAYGGNGVARLNGFVVFCSSEDGLEGKLRKTANDADLKHVVLSIDNPAGPEGYKLARDADVTVVLIEHDMDLVFSFADRISVLAQGALFAEGTVAEISKDPDVKAIYLGEDA